APRVIRATEVFGKPGRDFIPLYSLMVATEPLGEDIWREIGAQERFTFAEASHLINYAQRTVDNRLAIGGRGATYPLGSTLLESKEQTPRVHENLRSLARSWFPVLNDVKFTHSWGGAVAITRDWEPYVLWNKETGRARLGGYAGDGVTMSYLAANTLAHEILEIESRFRKLHFVNRPIRQWEPEPLRYLAINSLSQRSRAFNGAVSSTTFSVIDDHLSQFNVRGTSNHPHLIPRMPNWIYFHNKIPHSWNYRHIPSDSGA
ncbi:MAG: hypothetical protein EBV91_05550, partial [Actinobacteria bacterium]|nr:hypothetical protein [Actinomycetota bacterium]